MHAAVVWALAMGMKCRIAGRQASLVAGLAAKTLCCCCGCLCVITAPYGTVELGVVLVLKTLAASSTGNGAHIVDFGHNSPVLLSDCCLVNGLCL